MRCTYARLGELLATVVLSLAFATLAYGQLGRGMVRGVVTDPSGAVIPGASVTLLNDATGVQRTVETNAAGLYRFDFTEVGSYTLRVSSKGFANYEVTKLIVTVAQSVTQDVQLELAKAAVQTITVEAHGVQMVSTNDAQISGLVSRSIIQNLPLEIRDTASFVNLMPGAVPDAFAGSTRGSSVNGQRGGTGNFMVDGVDNNDYGQGGRSHNSIGGMPGGIVSISPDAVQEFRVVTNNYSAQYGRQGGFVADMVLKSGTNMLHGSVFEYNRNQATTANDFFSNKAGIKDSLVRNQFGGSLGGPIKKDKMFLFGAVELQRLRQSSPVTTTGLRQEFIDWVDTGGLGDYYGLDCADPDQGMACTLGPIFRDLNSRFPLPVSTTPVTDDDYVSTSPLFGGETYPVPMFGQVTFPDNLILNQNRWNLRYDYQASSKDTFTARYLFDDFDEFGSTWGGDVPNPAFGWDGLSRSQSGSFGYTRVVTPTIVNDYRMNYLRHTVPFHRNYYPEVPSIFTIDVLGLGFGMSSAIPQKFTENTFQFQDNISVIKGRHTFRLGVEYRRTRNGSSFEADRDGIFYFWDTESMLTDGAMGDLTGLGGFYLAEASTDPSSPTPRRPEYYRGYRANEFGAFIEDAWKVNNRLTLTMGLRFDYFGPPHNFRSGLDSNFYFGSPNLNQCILRQATKTTVCFPGSGMTPLVSTNPYYPSNDYTASVFSGTFQQRDAEIWNKDTNNFAPRFGLAWDLRGNQKTVLRLGGGIFYDRLYNNVFENIRFNAPFFAFSQWGYAGNGVSIGPISTPGFYSIPIDIANFAGPGAAPSPRHMDQNIVAAYSEQYNVDLQQQLWGNWLLDVAYVGTLGHKLTSYVDVNTFPGRSGFGYSSRRINPNIGGDNMRGNWWNSNYSSLQVRVSKRMSRGLTFDSNYTWGHALDSVSDLFNPRSGATRPEDAWNRQLEYGSADFDLRHRFVTSFLYDLPGFKSNKILGGWSLNGVFTLQSGMAFTVLDASNDINGDGLYYDRANYYGSGSPSSMIDHGRNPADGYLSNPDVTGQTNPWTGNALATFDTTIVDFNDPWSYGPVNGYMARNALFGPGFVNADFSLQKKFKFTERTSMTLIVSSFNIWNHQNMDNPVGDVSNPDFGMSRATISAGNSGTGGRVMQWALRFDF
jgi:hypothetical protein